MGKAGRHVEGYKDTCVSMQEQKIMSSYTHFIEISVLLFKYTLSETKQGYVPWTH